MKREEMTCATCIKAYIVIDPQDPMWKGATCRLLPKERRKSSDQWCAQGEWHKWDERDKCFIPYFWGQWQGVDNCGPGLREIPIDLRGRENV